MGKIQCVYDKDNNFFFHLMSVAKVGYDNAYGEKHQNSMSREDVATLKKYEKELTMKGGEYDGKLFWTGMYAGNAQDAINKIQSEGGFPGFESFTDALLEIFGIFLKYHDDYCEKIWPEEEMRLDQTARALFVHEYIIALLGQRIPFAIDAYDKYEGLAEYYTEELIGKTYNFTNMDKYIEFYRMKMSEKAYAPEELFEMAGHMN